MKIVEKLKAKWTAETPVISKWIINASVSVSGCSVALMGALIAASSRIPQWFDGAYPYLVGIPAVIAFVSKFTVKKQ
jgi:hypothetical protein